MSKFFFHFCSIDFSTKAFVPGKCRQERIFSSESSQADVLKGLQRGLYKEPSKMMMLQGLKVDFLGVLTFHGSWSYILATNLYVEV